MSDECNDSCGQRIIDSRFLELVAWIIGTLAIFLNSVSLCRNISTIADCKSEPALLNNGLIALISLGDFLMGLYLSVIAGYDSHYDAAYCWRHPDWISSNTCAGLGVISTTASQISLYSMTVLSLLRLSGIKKDFVIPRNVSRRSICKLLGILVMIVGISLVISIMPLMKWLEDFFVNGVRFAAYNTLFHGCPNKKILEAILDEYYGKNMADNLKWATIMDLVQSMFSSDHGGISYKRQSFYGNDGVCLFKYFVTNDDPQVIFVFILLCFNFSCFVIIGLSYGMIMAKAIKSKRKVALKSVDGDKAAREMKTKLQRITVWIIFTDFVCWVPFIVVCCFHYLEILDSTSWYPFFSILVLPINSVINPIIYDNCLHEFVYSVCCKVVLKARMMKIWLSKKLKQKQGDDNVDVAAHTALELKSLAPDEMVLAGPAAHPALEAIEEVQKKDVLEMEVNTSFSPEPTGQDDDNDDSVTCKN